MGGHGGARDHGIRRGQILARGKSGLVGARAHLIAFSRERDLSSLRVVDASSVDLAQVLAGLKLSFGQAFDIWRSAPSGKRFEVLGKVRRALRETATASAGRCFDIGEFKNWDP